MKVVRIADIHSGKVEKGGVKVQGWVKTHRKSKSVAFIELSDGSSVKGLQLVIDPELAGYQLVAAEIGTGSSIVVEGTLVDSPARGQLYECQVSSLNLVGNCDSETYVLQKKGHTLEFLREHMHLRARSNTIGAALRVRSRSSHAVHTFFQERNFVYIHAPIITAADCEGAGEMFQVTTLPLNQIPTNALGVDYAQDFFKERAGLTVSGQLEAEAFACALSNVYTFGPTFRAENSNTARHLAEFWMIEPEMAFCELEDDMLLAEQCIKFLIAEVLQSCADDLEFLHSREWVDQGLFQTLESVSSMAFEVMDYSKAIDVLEKSSKKFEFPVTWGMDLQSEHERYLTDEYVKGPLIVINYPKEIKAFYMRLNDDDKTVRAMDVLVPRLGEIIGGSQREERADILDSKMRAVGINPEDLWWYLELRKFGTVPHAGFGLGFERFLMYVTGIQNIRDIIPMPRYPGHAKF